MRTEVELGDGQSFVIAGLLDNEEIETFRKMPLLGDIPVLGKLFQSISRSKTNTELIVICTAELVSPIPAGEPLPQLKLPEKFLPPIETLIDSMKPETPLIIEGSGGGFGGASAAQPSNNSSSSGPSLPSPAP